MKTIRERRGIKNANYTRFYQFNPAGSEFCRACPARTGTGEWEEVFARCLGAPVHTNWKNGEGRITTVYICESPSDKETSHGLPSVGSTGKGIYKKEFGELEEGWLDVLDRRIYRTNIVRCQADAGLQKRANSTKKNQRVRKAFDFCRQHLRNELTAIFKQHIDDGIGELKVVIAIGTDFPKQVRAVEDMIRELQAELDLAVNVSEMNHPSASEREDLAE